MVNDDIKNVIASLRTEGKSFRKISEILKEEYGVNRSQQAIQSMYARMLKKEEYNNSLDRIDGICDIINVYALGYNMTQVHEIVAKLGINISYNSVISVIKSNQSYVYQVNNALTAAVIDLLVENESINAEQIKTRLSYKGIPITDKKYNQLIKLATSMIIDRQSILVINRALELTRSWETVKELCYEKQINSNLITNQRRGN